MPFHPGTTLLARASAVCFALLFCGSAVADWPRWGGPNGDFSVPGVTGLVHSWGLLTGPKQYWSRDLGDGYSAIVTDGRSLYTMFRKGQQEVTVALDAMTGATVWEATEDAPFSAGMDMQYGPGPHSSPLIAGDRLFTVGILARLSAFDRKTGKRLWTHDLWKDFGGDFNGRGFAVSPVAYGDTVITKIGGTKGAVVAFRQKDGFVAWTNQSFSGAPATPSVINVDGQDQLVVMSGDAVMGLDPANGNLYWQHPPAPNTDSISLCRSGGRTMFCL